MNILKNVEKVFSENHIRYFKGNDPNENILSVPYRGIEDRKNHINIYMDIDEKLKMIKFTFAEKKNDNINVSTIKSKLLDLNSSLVFGNLSMRSESDTIEYRVDYQLNEDSFSFDRYNMFIVYCIKVYEKLKEEDLI